MIHTVIFDVGGTLIGAPDLFKELSALFPGVDAYKKLKTTLMNEYLAIGKGQKDFATYETLIKKTLLQVSRELELPDVSMKAREVYYNTYLNLSFVYPDTIPTLESLKKNNIKMLVASDALMPGLLEKFNLVAYFDKIYVAEALKAYKPNDRYVTTLKSEITPPYEKILFVGDSDSDILTGHKLAVRTVLKGSTAGKSCVPDYTITNLDELLFLIDK